MSLMIASIAIGLVLAAGVFFGTYALLRPYWALERIRTDQSSTSASASLKSAMMGVETFLKSVGQTIPRNPEELSRQGLRLVKAGIRRKDGPFLFVGIQAAVALTVFLSLGATNLVQNTILSLVIAVFAGAALPDIALKLAIGRRQLRIQNGLPDALDLTVVCVEAGLGLNQALMRIGQEIQPSHPELSDELNLSALEVAAGRPRAEAMRNLARRNDLEDLKALAAILIQTDRFGTSIGQSLRVFADGMRVKRRQRAEERAAKMAVKMILPMILFIFPAIFVVVVGPAIISIIQRLLPILGGEG